MTQRPNFSAGSFIFSRIACAVLGMAGLCGFSGAAQASSGPDVNALTEIPIENLVNMEVYSASRFVQDASEAPSAVSVLTANDIKTFGWRTLAEALRSLPGLYTSYDRNYTYLGARGFSRSGDYNPRFLLLIDGNRANDPIYDQAMIGTEFAVDIDLIDRIEYVPGAGSAVYGSNAFFGVINVITKKGRDIKGWQISGEMGSYGARKERLTYGWHDENGADVLMSATSYQIDGRNLYFPEFASTSSHGVAHGLDYDRGRNFLLKGTVGPFGFSLVHSERTKGTPTASFEQAFNAQGAQIVDEQTLMDFSYRKMLSEKADLTTRLFFNQYNYAGRYIYSGTSGLSSLRVNQDDSTANWWGGEVKLTSVHIDGHKLVTGVEYQKSNPIRQENYNIDPYQSLLSSSKEASRAGIYAQDEWRLRQDLLLNLGLRYDHNSVSDKDMVNPRLGVIYHLSPVTTLKALYGKSYRLPNAYELYYQVSGTGGQKANPDLQTERIRSYELVAEHRLSPSSRISVSAFRNKVDGLITLVQDPADGMYVFRNIDSAIVRGVEMAMEKDWRSGARLRSSYSWQRTENASTGDTLENSPKHLAKLNFSLPVMERVWRAGFETLYVGNRNTTSSQAGGYLLSNLTLFSNRLVKNVEVSASVYNLFDRHYADPTGDEFTQEAIAQDGRNFRFKLSYSY